MDLIQLKYFQVVAQLENVTRAAEELHIAQPSLSNTIRRLEKSIGVPLFERQGRRIRLNQFGEVFLRRVKRIFDELEQAKRELADMVSLECGNVTVGATISQIFPDLFGKYLTYYPNVKFRLIQVAGRLEIPQQLINGEFDLCISSLPIEQPIGQFKIHREPLVTEEIFLAVPANHRLAMRNSIQLSEIADESFISPPKEDGLRDITTDFCKQAGFVPNIVFESSTTEVICSLVRTGLGVAFLPAFWLNEKSADSLVRLHIKNPSLQRTIWLSWVKDRYLPAATRNFSKFIINYFSQVEINK
ncbi:LysR family transcriptional regulator [Pectinatus haikarae]|uniref:DNA-binding transcriptional LysR family regulator n=1 Tax=Pectinatus haikarae TaxID=349096 RepID=A0ABT9YB15_9FIRM|nr:LysR family transcriptional regulator [Pectinatus haikarae]MDQ0205024.1 DNA-binding transcriptional LysR family regulator [Pectinatus haikarae]